MNPIAQNISNAYVEATFQALTDAILPETHSPEFAPYHAASDLCVHEYIIYGLNHYIAYQQQIHHTVLPLAYPTAVMLDVAASQLVHTGHAQPMPNPLFPNGRQFTLLSREDRIRALAILENLEVDLFVLPSPYQNNAGLVKHVTDALNRFSMFGYYSEWPAYGSTRLYPPQIRRLEYFPVGWQQAQYPGVSLGYRDFRGFLLKMGRNEDDL